MTDPIDTARPVNLVAVVKAIRRATAYDPFNGARKIEDNHPTVHGWTWDQIEAAASQADTARAEGIALGLAMAARMLAGIVSTPAANVAYLDRKSASEAILALAPIQPPVAAARVLLGTPAALATLVDEAECAAGTGVSFNVVIGRALREVAALEQIAKERPNNETQ